MVFSYLNRWAAGKLTPADRAVYNILRTGGAFAARKYMRYRRASRLSRVNYSVRRPYTRGRGRSNRKRKYKLRRNKGGKIKGVKRKKTTLAKKVSTLYKNYLDNKATHTYRHRRQMQLYVPENRCAQQEIFNFGKTALETCLKKLEFYDPATGTLVERDAGSGAYNKDIYCSVYSVGVIKNNSTTPVVIDAYVFEPKGSTGKTPDSCFATAQLTDQGSGLDSTRQLTHVSDSEAIKDTYKILNHKHKTLFPGQSMKITYSNPRVRYDNSYMDFRGIEYLKQMGAHFLWYRARGIIGHDEKSPAASNMGCMTTNAMIDVMYYRKVVVSYDAGARLTRTFIDDDVQDPSGWNADQTTSTATVSSVNPKTGWSTSSGDRAYQISSTYTTLDAGSGAPAPVEKP